MRFLFKDINLNLFCLEMDTFTYVPGQTDLNSLPKDILILLLQRIEQDTSKHYKINKRKFNDLQFRVDNCHCEYDFVTCSFPDCEARSLSRGKYDDVYDECYDMTSCKVCKIDNFFCDKHIECIDCKVCSKHSKHSKCKYCDMVICPLDMPSPISYSRGVCPCGEELSYVEDYYCDDCVVRNPLTGTRQPFYMARVEKKFSDFLLEASIEQEACQVLNSEHGFNCHKCNKVGCKYLHFYYKCHSCYHDSNACLNCGLRRHAGCKVFDMCINGCTQICPECNITCTNCRGKMCSKLCKDDHYCVRDEKK